MALSYGGVAFYNISEGDHPCVGLAKGRVELDGRSSSPMLIKERIAAKHQISLEKFRMTFRDEKTEKDVRDDDEITNYMKLLVTVTEIRLTEAQKQAAVETRVDVFGLEEQQKQLDAMGPKRADLDEAASLERMAKLTAKRLPLLTGSSEDLIKSLNVPLYFCALCEEKRKDPTIKPNCCHIEVCRECYEYCKGTLRNTKCPLCGTPVEVKAEQGVDKKPFAPGVLRPTKVALSVLPKPSAATKRENRQPSVSSSSSDDICMVDSAPTSKKARLM